jgi:hypothetical protein
MSNKGGAREGAGRKKGIRNRRTCAQIAGAATSGMMPLQYMLSVMRDSTVDDDRRDEMAKAAAPYLHPKLSPVENLPSKQSDPEPDDEGGDHELPDFRKPN